MFQLRDDEFPFLFGIKRMLYNILVPYIGRRSERRKSPNAHSSRKKSLFGSLTAFHPVFFTFLDEHVSTDVKSCDERKEMMCNKYLNQEHVEPPLQPALTTSFSAARGLEMLMLYNLKAIYFHRTPNAFNSFSHPWDDFHESFRMLRGKESVCCAEKAWFFHHTRHDLFPQSRADHVVEISPQHSRNELVIEILRLDGGACFWSSGHSLWRNFSRVSKFIDIVLNNL